MRRRLVVLGRVLPPRSHVPQPLLQSPHLRGQYINGPRLTGQHFRHVLGHAFMMGQPDFQFDQPL